MLRRCHVSAVVALAIAAAVVVAGCGDVPAQTGSTSVRTCSEVGSGGLAKDYRQRAVILGPLALANVRTFSSRQSLPGRVGRRYGAYEIIAVVRHGATVTIDIPRSEWATVGLLYSPRQFRSDGAYLVKDLSQAVRLTACKSVTFNDGVSQFDGGFVVTRPQCVHFSVGSAGRTYAGRFPAAASCPGWRSVAPRN